MRRDYTECDVILDICAIWTITIGSAAMPQPCHFMTEHKGHVPLFLDSSKFRHTIANSKCPDETAHHEPSNMDFVFV